MDFIIVTGLSGAGKSRAVDSMEDIGFYCVDNIPPKLIPTFYDLCKPSNERVAVVTDIRGGKMFNHLIEVLDRLKKENKPYKILYLDAREDILLRRYKETRRKHPLIEEKQASILEAIKSEKEILKTVKEQSDYVIDTSYISPAQLKSRISSLFLEDTEDALMVNCESFGFKYGTTKDYILSLTVVLADGSVMKFGARTIKDAVGYHLNQLIIGSEGTLAIVVEAELKLIPKPEAERTILAYYSSIEDAVKGVNNILKAKIFPSTIDFMDKNSINTVQKFYPCNLDTTKEAMLLVEADGFECSLCSQIEIIKQALTKVGATSLKTAFTQEEKNAIWTARRSSYAAAAQLAPDVVSDDIIVPRKELAKLICEIKSICNKYNLQVCLVGHVGDGNVHPQIVLNLENDNEFKNYTKAKSEIYELTLSLGGTISAEHGVGVEKMFYVNKTIDENALYYMKLVKKLFDPNNILNPGKIFGL